MATINQQVDQCLSVLRGLPLWSSGRAAGLQWFSFGARHVVPTRQGGNKEVGDFALHVQCAWRVCGPTGIVVASRDRYIPRRDSEAAADFDWDTPGGNRCDERMAEFLANHAPLIVASIRSDNFGGFNLSLDQGFSLDVFPDDSEQSEHWRFFRPTSDERHSVLVGQMLRQPT